jgi:hypothetical protein
MRLGGCNISGRRRAGVYTGRITWGLYSSPVSFRVNHSLKVVINTGLFHDPICGMADTDFTVDRKIFIGDGAMPYIMIAFSAAYKITPMIL